MPILLQLDSSADLIDSRTRAITSAFAQAWRARGAEFTVVTRDLHTDPLPHLASAEVHGLPGARHEEHIAPQVSSLQSDLLGELLSADVLLVGAPMYNYNIPSTLKAWIDYVHLPGLTAGVGTMPLTGRDAVLVSARGGAYDDGTPTEGWDLVTPYLELLFGSVFGMNTHFITTNLTLADRAPELAQFLDRSRAELAASLTAATALAGAVGSGSASSAAAI